jgi:hypothetical protein
MAAHWSAKAALEPTRPPPPMMLTFIRSIPENFTAESQSPPRNLEKPQMNADEHGLKLGNS